MTSLFLGIASDPNPLMDKTITPPVPFCFSICENLLGDF
jgi:hypothetical protein